MQNDQLLCSLHGKSTQYLIQYWIRMTTLLLALIATLFIIITCVLSKQIPNFLIKLIIAQSTAESIVLITSLIVSYQSDCWQEVCQVIGYIRYCFWFSSLSCSFLIVYSNYYYIQDTQLKCKIHNDQIIKRIKIAFIWPLVWLATPLCFKQFGAAGWKLYETDTVFHVFCGFSQDANYLYYIFWQIPLFLLVSLSFYISIKNKQALIRDSQDELVIPKTFQIGIQIYPRIYLITWSIELLLRQIERIPYISNNITSNLFLYMPYSIFLLAFHLHICIACYYFFKNYKTFLKIPEVWKFNNLR